MKVQSVVRESHWLAQSVLAAPLLLTLLATPAPRDSLYAQAGTNAPPTNGLLAHWTFDETSGTVLNDASGNQIHGTVHGYTANATAQWTAGLLGGALALDGKDDYISFPGATKLNNLDPFTWTGWFRLEGEGGYVLAKRSETSNYWRIYAGPENVNWHRRFTGNSHLNLNVNYGSITGQWHHLALSWNGQPDGDHSIFYLDGQPVTAQPAPATGQPTDDCNNLFTIGNRPQGNSSFYTGLLDDYRIYSRVLTNAEVQQVYDYRYVNQPPAGLNIDNDTVAENRNPGQTVGTLSATDPDDNQSSTLDDDLVLWLPFAGGEATDWSPKNNATTTKG